MELKKERIHFIDTARGIFLYWMIAVHSLTLSGLPRDSILWLLQPGGWATTSFVMLSGFSAALIFFKNKKGFLASKKRILRRSKEIAIIAYLSNLVFTSLRLIIESSFSIDALIKIATFQYKWGISGALIPIALILWLTPLLIALTYKSSPWTLFSIMFLINTIIEVIPIYSPTVIQENMIFQICFFFDTPYFDFPIIRLTGLAMLSFSLGILFKKEILSQKHWVYITPICLLIYILYKVSPFVEFIILEFVLHTIKFLISIGIALILCKLPFLLYLRKFFELLGRSSLMIFIAHRIILQGILVLFTSLISTQKLLVIVMIFITLGVSTLLCWIKDSNEWLTKKMKRIGF